jgi:quercetin dioxygenase-like cupin family protein
MDDVTVLHRDELEAADGTSDVSRQVAFETEDTVMVRSRVAGGVTTGWHHNGDRHVYGYVTHGHAVLEYGADGEESVTLAAGDFVYVPPRTVRRVANPTGEDWVIVICFVGTGPPAIAVDDPWSEDE